jgi:hypothetical protein
MQQACKNPMQLLFCVLKIPPIESERVKITKCYKELLCTVMVLYCTIQNYSIEMLL